MTSVNSHPWNRASSRRNRSHYMSATAAAITAYAGLASVAHGQWTVTRLCSNDVYHSYATGVHGGQQVGAATVGNTHGACLWSGTPTSLVDLSPAASTNSGCRGTSGGQQVGIARFFADGNPFDERASLWTGTAASWIDLSPAGSTMSDAFAVSDGQQVGTAVIDGVGRAGLWHGTAASWVDLSPAGSTNSCAFGVDAGQQVGYADFGSGNSHAGLWNGTSGSWVALHPTGANSSMAWSIHAGQQVGWASFLDGWWDHHAVLWTGTSASCIDLHPAGATNSLAEDVYAGHQVGYALLDGVYHASLWTGTAASWEDLALALPGSWGDTYATEVWSDSNTLFVVGYGFNNTTGRDEALMWSRPFVGQCPADFDSNGFVNGDDFDEFVAAFEAADPACDINGDMFVNGDDFDLFTLDFEAGC